MEALDPLAHQDAAAAFTDRAKDALGDELHELVVFGSTARGDTCGRDSDVDVLVVLEDGQDEDALRDIAYDVSLEYGVVLSLVVETVDGFASRRDHPFIRNALREGRSYV